MTQVRLSAVIMTHPNRLDLAERIQRDHPELGLRLVVDPDPDGIPSALRTARVAWGAVAEGATHHLVLQDDVALGAGMADQLRAAITARPRAAISLFAEHGLLTASVCRIAALLGSPWAEVADSYVPTQGLVLEADVARGYEPWSRRLPEGDVSEDSPLLWYLRELGVPRFVTVPNLLEHTKVPSLLNHDFAGRRTSVCFGPSGWDWRAPATTPRMVPFIHWLNGRSLCLFGRQPGREDWLRIGTGQLLARRGLPAAAQAAELDRALAAAGMDAESVARVGRDHVRHLWLTAFAIGVAAAELREPGAPPLESALSTPAAARGIATVARGILWRWVRDEVLEPALPGLDGVVEAGVGRGLAWTAS
jgi:hypothetical protein